MIDDELLYRLSESSAPVQPRPMAEIARRAEQLRLRRRVGWAGTTVLALGLIGALAIPLWPHQDRSLVTPAKQDLTRSCNLEDLSWAEYPELAYLPPRSIAPRVMHVLPLPGRWAEPWCRSTAASGSWYSLASDGTVAKKLIVRGPDEDEPLPVAEGLAPQKLDQDDRTGTFAHLTTDNSKWSRPPGYNGWVWWTEKDGSRWRASAIGMTKAEMLAAVKSLSVEQGRLDTRQVPTGLTTALPTYTGPTGDAQVDLGFGAGKERFNLLIHQIHDSAWQAPVGCRQVTVNGAVGWMYDDGVGQDLTLTWELAPGVIGSIHGSIGGKTTPGRLLSVAAATEKIPITDSRLTRRK
ncbi:MAG TPA: hypothetical protein VLL08_19700 [Kineosporiaceae bacterium]|nr:hypothetical protein [Kineosporiaceae bacterium]